MTEARAPQQWIKDAAAEINGVVLGKLKVEGFNQRVQIMFSQEVGQIIAAHCPRQEAQWISVEEKLPEHNNEYLVVEHGDIYAIPADWIVGEWFTVRGFGYESETRELHNVTHWMPLPSAPSVEAGLSDTKEK